MPPPKTCTRNGCTKTLRSNNTKGVCSSGCLSQEAPPEQRELSTEDGAEVDVLVRFKKVAKALGKDPDAILDAAMRKVAAHWLETIEAAVQ